MEIVYTITEDAVTDYRTKIEGYDVINKYAPPVIPGTDIAPPEDELFEDDIPLWGLDPLPQTGKATWQIPVISGLGAMMLCAGMVMRRKKGKREK